MKAEKNKLTQASRWLSLCVLSAYFFVFAEAIVVISGPVSTLTMTLTLTLDQAERDFLIRVVHHLSAVYLLELALAAFAGVCTMAGGWTRLELLLHHGPYIVAVMMVIHAPGQYDPNRVEHWWPAMATSLLTAANEALLIVEALEAPAWVGKARRLYGFSIILSLFLVEFGCYTASVLRAVAVVQHASFHLSQKFVYGVLGDAIVLGAIYYHGDLLRMYVRRWMRKKTI